MLRRLRIKFILINMLLVTLVLLAVFGTLVYSTASQLERESVNVMTLMLRRDGIPPQFEIKMPLPGSEREWQSVIPVFCVSVDAQGQITLESGENVKVSEDVVEQAVEQVLASGAQRGKLSDLGLRFLIETNKDGETQIAFSDLSWERASLWRLVLNSLLIGAGALVEDMLFLAKHDDARQSAKTQVCNLSDLVTGCVLRFESVAFESGVELDSEIQPRLSIHGDLDCLERLVMILLDNAVKYAGEAGQVRLELQRRQERAVLTVTLPRIWQQEEK